MNRKLEISQCMIVKNESANIERALNWGKHIMFEQIVVDTGSIDETIRLAKDMGAKVYNFPWIDDFAAAKNFAISKAEGKWIAFLDADEYLAANEEYKLCQILEQLEDGYDAVSTGWMQLGAEGEIVLAGTQVQIFRNNPGLCYRRRIHEQLGFIDGRRMRIWDAGSEIAIFHTGYYGTSFTEKIRNKRNLYLIEKELEESPDDYEMAGYMGDEYYDMKDYEQARMWYERSVAGMPKLISEHDQRSAATFTRLMLILIEQGKKGEQDKLQAIYEKGVKMMPKEADLDYILGNYFAQNEDYERGSEYLRKAFDKLNKYGFTDRSMMLAANLEPAYENIVVCYYHMNCVALTVEFATILLKRNPGNFKGLYYLLKSFRGDEIAKGQDYSGSLVGFLRKLYNFNSMKDKVLLLRAAQEASYGGLLRKIEVLITDEEWVQLKQLGIERS